MRHPFVAFKNQSLNKVNPFHFNWQKNNLQDNFSWQMIHNKTLRISGKGGKGHLRVKSPVSWNRKGRWQ